MKYYQFRRIDDWHDMCGKKFYGVLNKFKDLLVTLFSYLLVK